MAIPKAPLPFQPAALPFMPPPQQHPQHQQHQQLDAHPAYEEPIPGGYSPYGAAAPQQARDPATPQYAEPPSGMPLSPWAQYTGPGGASAAHAHASPSAVPPPGWVGQPPLVPVPAMVDQPPSVAPPA